MADHRIPSSEIRRVWMDPDLSTTEAARKVGLARSNLWRRAKALGLPPREPGNKEARIDEPAFRAMWAAGVSLRAMGDFFGLHPLSIRAIRARLKLKPRPCGGRQSALTLDQYRQMVLAERMAETARRERAALREMDMIDVISARRA